MSLSSVQPRDQPKEQPLVQSPSVPDVMVRAERVFKSYGRVEALRGLDLEIPAGAVTCLVGPSGSGKSTLLRCIAHLDTIDSGRLWVNGCLAGFRELRGRFHAMRPRELAARRRQFGLVSERLDLFAHLTVLQNVIVGPVHVRKEPADVVYARSADLLRRFGISRMTDVYPCQLSGGEQQRVAIVRALAMRPSVLLLDEPTSALDPASTGVLCQVLRETAHEGTTVIIVSGGIGLAHNVGDVLIRIREGRLVQAYAVTDKDRRTGPRPVSRPGQPDAQPGRGEPTIGSGSADILSFP